MAERYTVLSPWARSGHLEKRPLNPRPESLAGKTIGLYASFKEYHPFFMEELEAQLAAALPGTGFSHYTYIVDTCEIQNDPAHYPAFKQWLSGVDTVIGVGADMGSCALYMGYIFAEIERLGKPALLLSKHQYLPSASKGAGARGYLGLRILTYDGPGFVPNGVDCRDWTIQNYRATLAALLPGLLAALTRPLTEAEARPAPAKDWSGETFTGTLEAVNDWLYAHGWTNGTPVAPPTREAVDAMLQGTDLAPGHVVARLPPLLGEATVEKIAINGVMAGCPPTYMPLLIAAVQAMADDEIKLEGWTCSNASWAPTMVVSGPIRRAIGINTGRNLLSPYTRPAACLARAVAYIIMNISGCRSQIEDMSGPGSAGRFGICLAEDEEHSPWAPLPTDFGYGEGDSCITLFWPSEHTQVPTASVSAALDRLCTVWHGGFDVGAMVVLPAEAAGLFAEAGYTKRDILDYMVEYNHRPSAEIPRAAIGNNHPREGLIFPAPGLRHPARLFWNTEHMMVLVGGADWGTVYLGGGDHGGPVCKKAELPKNWDALSKKYPGNTPVYVDY